MNRLCRQQTWTAEDWSVAAVPVISYWTPVSMTAVNQWVLGSTAVYVVQPCLAGATTVPVSNRQPSFPARWTHHVISTSSYCKYSHIKLVVSFKHMLLLSSRTSAAAAPYGDGLLQYGGSACNVYSNTPWAIKRSQLIFVCNFAKNQRILVQVSLLDLKMNGTCDVMNFTHLT